MLRSVFDESDIATPVTGEFVSLDRPKTQSGTLIVQIQIETGTAEVQLLGRVASDLQGVALLDAVVTENTIVEIGYVPEMAVAITTPASNPRVRVVVLG